MCSMVFLWIVCAQLYLWGVLFLAHSYAAQDERSPYIDLPLKLGLIWTSWDSEVGPSSGACHGVGQVYIPLSS